MMKTMVLVTVCVASGLVCLPVSGNDGAIRGVGGAVELLDEHPSVAMDSMQVEIELSPEAADVDCRYRFRNTGEATAVRMGFPESAEGDVGGPDDGGFTTFQTWVDGREVPTEIEGSGRLPAGWSRWRVKTVPFAAGQERAVRVHFTADTGTSSWHERFFEYEVGPGASWKGAIGEALIRVHLHYDSWQWQPVLDGCDLMEVEPGLYEASKVDYQPDRRSARVRVRFLQIDLDALANAIGSTAYGVRATLPDYYGPPTREMFTRDVQARFTDPKAPPWIAGGDFDGDGAPEVAVLLLKGDQMGLGLLRCTAIGAHGCESIDFQWLPGSPHERLTLLDGTLFSVLRTHPPGEVAYYAEGETSPKSGRLILEHDGIEVIAWGKAASLWYWDEQSPAFKSVVTAD